MFVSQIEEKDRLTTFIDAVHAYHEIMRDNESDEIPWQADEAIIHIETNKDIVPLCRIDVSSRAVH